MADDYSAQVGNAAMNSASTEIQKAHGDPSKIDYKKIAQATAAAGAAAVCAYVSLGAAAVVCGWAASEAVGWFADKGIPAIGHAFNDVGHWLGFGKDRPKPTLVGTPGSDHWYSTNLVPPRMKDESQVLAAAIQKLQALHKQLNIPGSYSTLEVAKRLREVHKLPMDRLKGEPPRGNWDYADAGTCTFNSIAADWTVHPMENRILCSDKARNAGPFNYYWAPDFQKKFEKAGGKMVADAQRTIMNEKTPQSVRLPIAKAMAHLVEQADAKYVQPWEHQLLFALAAETAYLTAMGVANKVAEQAKLGPKTASGQPRHAPPKLEGNTLWNVATAQMSDAEIAKWRACMHAKVVAAGDGATRNEYYVQCRRQVIGAPKITMAELTSLQTINWRLIGVIGLGALGGAYVLRRRKQAGSRGAAR